MTNPLDRDIVRKTMAGYAEVNQITDAERGAHLGRFERASKGPV
jgi:hypothetical protein